MKCTVHYIVYLHCISSLSHMCESNGFWHFSMGMGTKEDKSSNGDIWAPGFHRVMARYHLAHALKHTKRLFKFPIFFQAVVNLR
jgi:hypothetical protein